ncbi:hypothetical protein LPJ53_001916 [Coemansia erecta]|uniref:Uncharacterized protein n=1 Tax=Coemansia erecta TaxID=147472 RepID=A0A9W8CU12_9FUNG|nr:hypothetical protein LPJ53_001916 [Coemansia erecta]
MFNIYRLFIFIFAQQVALAMNVTCASFGSLQQVTYDNVQPQSQVHIIIGFADDTSKQVMDAYRDALTCRGATMNTPNYNTLTLVGYTSKDYALELRGSDSVVAVEYDSAVSMFESFSSGTTFGSLMTGTASDDESPMSDLDNSDDLEIAPGNAISDEFFDSSVEASESDTSHSSSGGICTSF